MSGSQYTSIGENRRQTKWSRKQYIGRLLWAFALPLFRFSPRPFWKWRATMLRLFGATVGREVHMFPSIKITIPWNLRIGDYSAIGDNAVLYALGTIIVGNRTTISQNAHICAGTHDISKPTMDLMKEPIIIGDDAWICADAFIGPGVTVGDKAIVGARAVVTKPVEANAIVAGNPAKKVKDRVIR